MDQAAPFDRLEYVNDDRLPHTVFTFLVLACSAKHTVR